MYRLDDEEIGGIAKELCDRRGDLPGMGVRVVLADAVEPGRDVAAKAIVSQHERGMLAGQD